MKLALALTLFVFVFALLWQFALTTRDRKLIFASPIDIKVGDITRNMYVISPQAGSEPDKLYIGLHAFGDSPKRFGYYTGLHNVVAANDLVIYPQSIDPTGAQRRGWNAGYCCGSGWAQEVDDVAFIAAIAKDFKAQYGEDKPVYLVGFSNGGMMAQRMLAEIPTLFEAAAVSGSSAGLRSGKVLQPKRSDSRLLLMHGDQDASVTFGGGASVMEPNFPWLSFQETADIWRNVLGSGLETHVYENLGHRWHDWRIVKVWHTEPEATKRAIEFFSEK